MIEQEDLFNFDPQRHFRIVEQKADETYPADVILIWRPNTEEHWFSSNIADEINRPGTISVFTPDLLRHLVATQNPQFQFGPRYDPNDSMFETVEVSE